LLWSDPFGLSGWFYDWQDERVFFTGTRKKRETKKMAEGLEDEHRQIQLGYRPPPTSADRHRSRPYAEIRDEYLEWGRAQGGRGGRGWSEGHLPMRESHLEWWGKKLELESLGDRKGVSRGSKRPLRDLSAKGRTSKTVKNYAGALRAFCNRAQDLARHSPPDMTMNTYARTRRENLQKVTESVGRAMEGGRKRAQKKSRRS
jgi:hypothetical protein